MKTRRDIEIESEVREEEDGLRDSAEDVHLVCHTNGNLYFVSGIYVPHPYPCILQVCGEFATFVALAGFLGMTPTFLLFVALAALFWRRLKQRI